MKTRPWPLILLALIQFFSPLGTIFFNAWAYDLKPIYILRWILEKSPLHIFENLILMPIAGLAIFWMKPWSYLLFFTAVFWSLGSKIANWDFVARNYSFSLLISIYALQIGLAIYFMIPAVRKTYLDASVRWWEAKRRFLLELPVALEWSKAGEDRFQKCSGLIQNISEGGVLLQSEAPLPLESVTNYCLRFQVLNVDFEAIAKVVYVGTKTATGSQYGLQFLPATRATEKRFSQLAQGLALIGVGDRDEAWRKPWLINALDWLTQLVKTGKGLLPDVKSNRKS